MPTIQAICFDADGVIVNPQMQFARHLAEAHGITPEMTRPFFRGAFDACLEGRARLEDVLPPFLRRWGWPGTLGEFIDTWMAKDHVIDARLMGAVQRLRRLGFTCALATSQERTRAAYMRAQMGFEAAFDHLFFSCEAGAQKPRPAFFEYAHERLGVPREAVLFWDDSPANVAAARSFGWRAAVYTGFEPFAAAMRGYGIEVEGE